VIVNGQKIAQRLVFWKLLGTGEDPSDMHRRILENIINTKKKRGSVGMSVPYPK
jgi:hypothetical protein